MINEFLRVQCSDRLQADICRLPIANLRENQILVRVESFPLTTNNVTYAALGKSLHYFEYFPLREMAGFGIVPVWGTGIIEASRHRDFKVGTRLYGFLPAARYAVLKPKALTATGFQVKRDMLQTPEASYNFYQFYDRDPFVVDKHEMASVAFRPQFLTGILTEDCLKLEAFRGASSILVSSASSKVSVSVAAALRKNSELKLIGLSSSEHKKFAESTGFFHTVHAYHELNDILVDSVDSVDSSVCYVDVCGDVNLTNQLREKFKNRWTGVFTLGASHGATTIADDVFFPPAWLWSRHKKLGDSYFLRVLSDWRNHILEVGSLFRIVQIQGMEAALNTYLQLAQGRISPEVAHMISP